MSKGWINMRAAKEELYFRQKDKQALESIRAKKIEKSIVHGIEIERDTESGKYLLNQEQLDQIISAAQPFNQTSSWKDTFKKTIR